MELQIIKKPVCRGKTYGNWQEDTGICLKVESTATNPPTPLKYMLGHVWFLDVCVVWAEEEVQGVGTSDFIFLQNTRTGPMHGSHLAPCMIDVRPPSPFPLNY